jgi:hypothetical protein
MNLLRTPNPIQMITQTYIHCQTACHPAQSYPFPNSESLSERGEAPLKSPSEKEGSYSKTGNQVLNMSHSYTSMISKSALTLVVVSL